VRETRDDKVIMTRVIKIIETLTTNVYNYTQYGLFVAHKLMFSFYMCIMIQESNNDLNREEFDFFLKGSTSLE
jgi:dynein heavy chain, axonemal